MVRGSTGHVCLSDRDGEELMAEGGVILTR